ncbi:MAG: SCP2 sterol-binding domain-containing protein [Actinomycetota bacterium]|nr:SCP2 sterol-binding domain-containing protein [Actinomycetota bacterium]
MDKHEFLSPAWTEAARKVREEYAASAPAPPVNLRMNLVVNDVPFGDGPIDAHLDTSAGSFELDEGHLDEADLMVTVDYETAKAILIDQNPQAGMQAFMAGRIRVEGDMSKLLALQATQLDPTHVEVAARMREITE